MHLLRKASRVGGNRTTKAQETRGPDFHYHSPFTQINVILMIYSKIMIVIMIINNISFKGRPIFIHVLCIWALPK